MLRGLLAAAKGRQGLPEPDGWPVAYQKLTADADPAVREQARSFALIFGSSTALDEFRSSTHHHRIVPRLASVGEYAHIRTDAGHDAGGQNRWMTPSSLS